MYKKVLSVFLVVIFMSQFVFQHSVSNGSTMLSDGFESGKIGKIWGTELASRSYSGRVVKTYAAQGAYSFRAELRKDDPLVNGSKRAEIRAAKETPLEEHWYAVSTYLPSGGNEDYGLDPDSVESIIEWHNSPDDGEEWTTPPLALWTLNGRYVINRVWDSEPLSTEKGIREKGNVQRIDIGSCISDKGKWVDWVFHVKWGWLESQEPVLEVYKNGEKVLDLNGKPNTTNDKVGVFMKLGISKWDWMGSEQLSILNKRVVYYDNFRMDNPEDAKLALENRKMPPIKPTDNYVSIENSCFCDGFESGRLTRIWGTELATGTYSGKPVKTHASSGDYSFRVELRKSDPDVNGKKRAEIRLPRENPLEEHWYAASIYLPKDGDEDYKLDPKSGENLIQWHNSPDEGEAWTNPPLALQTRNGNYYIVRVWDDAPLSTDAEISAKGFRESRDLGSYIGDKGKWVKWLFHVKWGWLKSQNPMLEVYKNGVKVLDLNGLPNTTNDKVGIFMKIGVYKWNWSDVPTNSILKRRVVYFDDVHIDDPDDSKLRQ